MKKSDDPGWPRGVGMAWEMSCAWRSGVHAATAEQAEPTEAENREGAGLGDRGGDGNLQLGVPGTGVEQAGRSAGGEVEAGPVGDATADVNVGVERVGCPVEVHALGKAGSKAGRADERGGAGGLVHAVERVGPDVMGVPVALAVNRDVDDRAARAEGADEGGCGGRGVDEVEISARRPVERVVRADGKSGPVRDIRPVATHHADGIEGAGGQIDGAEMERVQRGRSFL